MKSVVSVFLILVMAFSCCICLAEDTSTTALTKAEMLLGESNGYQEFSLAQRSDESNYEYQLTCMAFTLADALYHTAKVGTPGVKAAIKSLIPDSVYKKHVTANDKIDAIYSYFTSGALSKYITITLDNNNFPVDAEINILNVHAFITDAIKCNVFTGTVGAHEQNPAITSFTVFCKKMNITKEVAIAYFEILLQYDQNWLIGLDPISLDFYTNVDDNDSTVLESDAKEPIEVTITASSAFLRDANGKAIRLMVQGETFTITGYDPSCEMFTAIHGKTEGYVKGTGLSVSKDELLEVFQ